MAVNLSPATALGFNRPFNESVKRVLMVNNRNHEPIAFKVKTTAPKAYCVRPNSGRVEPGESIDIQVILQPMKEDPPPSAKCKDKFLVQSMTITPDMVNTSLGEMWSIAEADPTSHPVHQQRVKVIFLNPEGAMPGVEEHVGGPGMDSTFLSVNDSRYDTVRSFPPASQFTNGTPVTHQEPINTSPTHGEFDRGTSPAPDFHDAPHIEDVAAPVVAPPAPVSQHDEELRSKYAEAQGEIERLRGLLASIPPQSSEGGVRRRKVSGGSDDMSGTGEQTEVATSIVENGVPPQAVAIIALVVFTLTYLFF